MNSIIGLAIAYVFFAIVNFVEYRGYKLPQVEMLLLTIVALFVAGFDLVDSTKKYRVNEKVRNVFYILSTAILFGGLAITSKSDLVVKITDTATIFSFAIILWTIGLREKNIEKKEIAMRPIFDNSTSGDENGMIEFFNLIIQKGCFLYRVKDRLSFNVFNKSYYAVYPYFTCLQTALIDGEKFGILIRMRYQPSERRVFYSLEIDKVKISEILIKGVKIDDVIDGVKWFCDKYNIKKEDDITGIDFVIIEDVDKPIEEYAMIYSDILKVIDQITNKIK